jgi:bacteriophage HK97-gp10 putative tail-component
VADAGVRIEGLTEFRAALRSAAARYPVELPRALKAAGIPIMVEASALAPVRTGALASGYKVSVKGTTAAIVSGVPYAGGAEWGQQGKWAGFTHYGPPGARFAGRAVEDQETAIALIVETELRDIIGAFGWFV